MVYLLNIKHTMKALRGLGMLCVSLLQACSAAADAVADAPRAEAAAAGAGEYCDPAPSATSVRLLIRATLVSTYNDVECFLYQSFLGS